MVSYNVITWHLYAMLLPSVILGFLSTDIISTLLHKSKWKSQQIKSHNLPQHSSSSSSNMSLVHLCFHTKCHRICSFERHYVHCSVEDNTQLRGLQILLVIGLCWKIISNSNSYRVTDNQLPKALTTDRISISNQQPSWHYSQPHIF